jgi:hypothetical protein
MRRAILLTTLLTLLAAVPAAQAADSDELAEAKRQFRQTYATELGRVRRSSDKTDDLKFARRLLIGANDPEKSDELRTLMAEAALDLSLGVVDDAAATLASKSIETIESIERLPVTRKAKLNRKVSELALQSAIRENKDDFEIRPLAKKVVEGHLAFIDAFDGEAELTSEVYETIREAIRLAKQYDLEDHLEQLEVATDQVKAKVARRRRFSLAEKKLKDAKDSGKQAQIDAARRYMAETHIDCDGDFIEAAEYIKGTGHSREEIVLQAAAFLEDGKLPADDPQQAVTTLGVLARQQKDTANRDRIARVAIDMGQALVKGKLDKAERMRVEKIVGDLKELIGDTPEAKFVARIDKAYDGLEGEISSNDGKTITLKYDFSDDDQLDDWEQKGGKWTVSNGQATGQGSGSSFSRVRMENRLRFDSRKPLEVTFTMTGATYAVLTLPCGSEQRGRSGRSFYFYLTSSTSYVRTPAGKYERSKFKIKPGKVYVWDVALNGKGGYVWKVNGQKIFDKGGGKKGLEDFLNVQMMFYRRSTDNSDLMVDDIVIEGTPVMPEED